MSETPSGNRWEPTDDDTAPVTPVNAPTPPTAAEEPGPAPAEPVAAPEYGWAPAPVAGSGTAHGVAGPRPARRRSGVLAAGAALVALAAGAGGYAVGAAAAGSDGQEVGTTRQGPPAGFAPGQGAPGQDGHDDDQFGPPDGDHDQGDSDGGTG